MHCVIGSSGDKALPLEEIEELRNELEVEPTTHPCSSATPVAILFVR
jgi:hypothetical protein